MMFSLRLLSVAALAITLVCQSPPAMAALPTGAFVPPIATQAVLAGKPFQFRLEEALKRGPVVLYFFPAAFTSGCSIEAHEFSDAIDQFAAAGATVIGLSHDPIDKLSRFSVTECRNKFAVGVASSQTISAYHVRLPVLAMSNRTSYVISPEGRILFVYSALRPNDHVSGTLAAVRAWRSAHPVR
jgi:peroxiredoxin Q/BCP